ncbi:dynein regulatory complex subunit 2-like [Prorops nasuta]|uniref:dynein regulatory complex subunit 2-like n=1 Tax=Prorops nasuta TaxID=863751 RepID=UPI0034CDD917
MVKKKSKGRKLDRMNEEERARYLQHRAELELEAKRRKQQLIATFIKNKLKHEETFSRLNTSKINEQWRFILRQIKCTELRNFAEYLCDNFERVMKAKDNVIRRIYSELEIADKDHRRLQEVHIDMINKLIERHKSRLMILHDTFKMQMKMDEVCEIKRLKEMKEDTQLRLFHMQNITENQRAALDNKLMEDETRNAVSKYNLIYFINGARSELLRNCLSRMENLWNSFNNTISDYEKAIETKKDHYECLKKQDEEHEKRTAEFPKLYIYLQHVADNLKSDVDNLKKERQEAITELKYEEESIKKKAYLLREKMKENQTIDIIELKKLSIASNTVIRDLKKIVEKAKVHENLIKLCSQLEPDFFILQKYLANEVTVKISSSKEDVTESLKEMTEFWNRHNYIKAENIVLRNNRNELFTKNEELRQILRTYLLNLTKEVTTAIPISRKSKVFA